MRAHLRFSIEISSFQRVFTWRFYQNKSVKTLQQLPFLSRHLRQDMGLESEGNLYLNDFNYKAGL